jgi:hypothetical protein
VTAARQARTCSGQRSNDEKDNLENLSQGTGATHMRGATEPQNSKSFVSMNSLLIFIVKYLQVVTHSVSRIIITVD